MKFTPRQVLHYAFWIFWWFFFLCLVCWAFCLLGFGLLIVCVVV